MFKFAILLVTSGVLFFIFSVLGALFRSAHEKSEFCYPVESGFLSFSKISMPFSLQFFLIMVMFVIFDVEILFLVFSPFKEDYDILCFTMIMLFIFFTLLMEWKLSKVVWV